MSSSTSTDRQGRHGERQARQDPRAAQVPGRRGVPGFGGHDQQRDARATAHQVMP
ncbi:hypothetical protein [Streptomyces sp. URMC 129]|uniref:hypothetical protein n=1 Tax=Streptomyces sp. URMC 129 TaxID=3423407 RepID=UPI003F1DED8B